MAGEARQTPVERTVAARKVLVVLPTYNEADNIVGILERLSVSAPEADVLVV
ncbi:MAG: hypothetical protein QOF21_3188, partial [Actinomycetota bacterium]